MWTHMDYVWIVQFREELLEIKTTELLMEIIYLMSVDYMLLS